MSRGNTWTNSDGLVVGYGTHTSDNSTPGATEDSVVKTMKVQIVGTELGDTFAATDIKPNAPMIKRGSAILAATLIVEEVFTGSSSTLDIGLWGASGTPAVDDADGIDAAVALTAIDALGDVVNCDGALVGGLIPVGRTADQDCVIAPSWGTAAFTAGKATLVVQYIEPQYTDPVAA